MVVRFQTFVSFSSGEQIHSMDGRHHGDSEKDGVNSKRAGAKHWKAGSFRNDNPGNTPLPEQTKRPTEESGKQKEDKDK
eukprot:2828763-Ditylum_brightwellii.AAC.1